MRRRKTNKVSKSNNSKYLLAGLTLSSALVMARPIIPTIVYAADANKYSWTKQNLDLIGGESVNRAATSASGSNLIVSSVDLSNFSGSGSGFDDLHEQAPLYVSNNYGASWQNVAEAADPGIANYWTSVDISSDGQTMVAASHRGYDLGAQGGEQEIDGKILISHNSGTSWSDITHDVPMNGGEEKVVVSGDGNTVAILNGTEDVYVSDDAGGSWASSDVDTDRYGRYSSISISDTGDKLLVGDMGSGSEFNSVYMSEDGGESWTGITPPTADPFMYPSTAISADGSKIAVSGLSFGEGGENDYAFTSNNDGQSWTNVTPKDAAWNIWSSIDLSDDGRKLAIFGVDYEPSVGGEDVSMYVSGNSGASWTKENTDASEAGSLYDFILHSSVDLNSYGSRAIVARMSGVYIGVVKPSVSLKDAEGGKTIALTTPDGTIITCSSAVKESDQAKQDDGYRYPLGLVNFCFDTGFDDNEVSLTYVTDLKPNEVTARKYNSNDKTYFDVPNATITQTTYEGKPALKLTYTITDNGKLDLNPANGKITDPVGLATTGDLANTGQNQSSIYVIAGLLTLPAAVYIVRRKKL